MGKTTFLLFLAFIMNSNGGFSHLKNNKTGNQHEFTLNTINYHPTKSFSERGLEIRYYVFDKKNTPIPSEITIDKVKYPLYKSKEDAVQSVTASGLKKDYTIVYVVSDKSKTTEVIAIAD